MEYKDFRHIDGRQILKKYRSENNISDYINKKIDDFYKGIIKSFDEYLKDLKKN